MTMEAIARAKFVRVSPSKARRYMSLIIGKPFEEAMAILEFKPSPIAEKIRKVLESAGANAEENNNMVKDDLFVTSALADSGPTLKRWRPRAMGRAFHIRKRTSHFTIVLSDEKPKRK